MRGQRRRGARVIVDLDGSSGVPSGRVIDELGVSHAFCGWLELMDEVGRALKRDRARATPGEGRQPEP